MDFENLQTFSLRSLILKLTKSGSYGCLHSFWKYSSLGAGQYLGCLDSDQ